MLFSCVTRAFYLTSLGLSFLTQEIVGVGIDCPQPLLSDWITFDLLSHQVSCSVIAHASPSTWTAHPFLRPQLTPIPPLRPCSGITSTGSLPRLASLQLCQGLFRARTFPVYHSLAVFS